MTSLFQNGTLILVHGEWADGSCWQNIILPLRRQGLSVTCAPIPLTSLTDDVAALQRVLERTNEPVVLVGHAYAGAVIAAAREERVKSLVYIAASAPDEGETVADVFYRAKPHPNAPHLAPADNLTVEDAIKKSPQEAGITRFGKPEEIADLMSYLVSPAARWMTGASIRMDGGEIKGIWTMGREEAMERRRFLGGLTAASFGALLENAFAEPARAQDSTKTGRGMADQGSVESPVVEVAGDTIFVRRYGKGPAILLVHGFPRTSLMWRFLAPKLAESHSVICVDLRAYGRSGIPASTDEHFPYSKRAMAKELVDVMQKLGFPTFTLIGHDRGGCVSYRMALDHPKNVERLAVFDVIPILEAWNRSDARFARTYWPWILLSQKQPLPESYLLGAPEAVFHNPFAQGSFGPEILEEYVSTYRDSARVHGICEEYRAAATIDVEHDRADKEASKRIECPMLHPWAEGGPLDTFYAKDGGPLGIWRQWAPHAEGQAMKGGHFFPEENPNDTEVLVKQFLSA
ncbi:MAG TPA: alpha/beta fold hydrolase [Candidatus Sulfotelmatobacter sp.]|nr:alpha/beta fold hydrolase [Candidatus Sulfotelmatobacter sp.]